MLPDLEPIARELAQTRQALDRVLLRLEEEGFGRAPKEGDYSGRQILAHLAGAERGMTQLLRRMAAGENPRLAPEYDNDYYNARQQQKRADRTVDQLRAELIENRADLFALMESLKPPQLVLRGEHPVAGDTTVLGLLQVIEAHERGHTRELEKLVTPR